MMVTPHLKQHLVLLLLYATAAGSSMDGVVAPLFGAGWLASAWIGMWKSAAIKSLGQ